MFCATELWLPELCNKIFKMLNYISKVSNVGESVGCRLSLKNIKVLGSLSLSVRKEITVNTSGKIQKGLFMVTLSPLLGSEEETAPATP